MKCVKYGAFSGPYFPVFGLNTETYYSVFGHISRSEYRKRLKENEGVYEKTKEKDTDKQKLQKNLKSPTGSLKKQRVKQSSIKYRKEKKTNKIPTPIKIFKTLQAPDKAKNSIRQHLQKSVCHKRELVIALAHDMTQKIQLIALATTDPFEGKLS